jgi:hypothetical protein
MPPEQSGHVDAGAGVDHHVAIRHHVDAHPVVRASQDGDDRSPTRW